MKIFRRKNDEAVSPVIAIILMVAITVVLASVLYVWVMNLAETDEGAAEFPTITVELKTGSSTLYENQLIINHESGDPIKWADYRIKVINISDDTKTTSIDSLTGELKFGENVIFSNVTGTGKVAASALGGIDLSIGFKYKVEIFDIKEQQKVQTKEVTCTAI